MSGDKPTLPHLEASSSALVELGRRIDSLGRPQLRWSSPAALKASKAAIEEWEADNPGAAVEHAALVELHQQLSASIDDAARRRMRGERPERLEAVRDTEALREVSAWIAGEEQWMVLIGPPGVGKTVAMRHFLTRKDDVVIGSVAFVAEVLRDERSEQRFVRAGTLALDDVGVEGTSEAAKRVLFSVLDARHEAKRRTILASNLSPDALKLHLGAALHDRVRSSCRVAQLKGSSLRGRT